MAKQLKLRRGTTSQHSSFTGAEGEVTVDTTKDTVVVHDGSTAGGIPLAKESAAYTHPNHSGEVTSSADGAQTIADNVVDEANLKVSNSPTNGQFLSAQSGNTGGLTWATPTTYTHPNHSGEVTSSADGAQTIANDVVDEANLKVSNAPTNGYFLSAQSGNTGGLTWAEVSQVLTEDGSDNLIAGGISGNRISGGSSNVILGDDAGRSITSGGYSIVFGKQAMGSDGASTTGGHNISMGYRSMYSPTSAENNIALGRETAKAITTGANNIVLGKETAVNLTTGSNNIILAKDAGYALTTGSNNVYSGELAGRNNTTGSGNIALGENALYGASGSTPANTIAIGKESFYAVTSGTDNVGVGYKAGYALTTGSDNLFLGYSAGDNVTTGGKNIVIGRYADASSATVNYEATIGSTSITKFRVPGVDFVLKDNGGTPSVGQVLTADSNGEGYWAAAGGTSTGESYVKIYSGGSLSNSGSATVAGYNAGGNLASGSDYNTLFGSNAGRDITSGNRNECFGYGAGLTITTGQYNSCIGMNAGETITTGSNNIAIGLAPMGGGSPVTGQYNIGMSHNALNQLTSGQYNIGIGYGTGYNITSGGYNTFIGWMCGYAVTTGADNTGVGKRALYSITTGSHNIAMGRYPANNITTGSGNVCIGDNSGWHITTGSWNSLLGYSAQPSGATVNNEITLGSNNVSSLRCNVQSISSLSDGRDKTDINTLDLGLDFINALNPVKFKWNSREGLIKDGTYEAGFIAQDLQQVQKDNNADYVGLVLESNPDRLEASYGNLIPMLVQAVKELSAKVTALEAK
jgi:hypothetical protein